MKNKIRCIAFDLDGVLCETKDLHKDALNKALIMYDLPPISEKDHIEIYDGLPTKVKLRKLIEKGVISNSALANEVEKLKQVYTEELVLAHLKPNKKLIKVITALREKYHVVCVTNTIKDMTNKILHKIGLLNSFDHIITNEDVAQNKPMPDPYIFAMDKVQCHPSQTLVIEDSHHGIESAKSAGCHIFPVTSPKDINLKDIEQFVCQINSEFYTSSGIIKGK